MVTPMALLTALSLELQNHLVPLVLVCRGDDDDVTNY